jgi:hypothetical protein
MHSTTFLTPSYYRKLDLFQEKPFTLLSTVFEKSKKILNAVKNANILEIQKDSIADFYHQVNSAIIKISLIKPGRKLFKRLLACLQHTPLKIKETHLSTNEFNPFTNCLFLNLNVRPYVVTEKKMLLEQPLDICFVHELIHVMHCHENREMFTYRFSSILPSQLLDSNFNNLEEQLTICGLLEENDEVSLCENVFLYVWKCNLRINHQGIYLNKTNLNRPNLYDFIKTNALGSIIEYINANPLSIHQLYEVEVGNEKRLLYPLSIASGCGKGQIVDYLIQCGSHINLFDQYGGPIISACSHHYYGLALKLIVMAPKQNRWLDTEFLLEYLIEKYKENIYRDHEIFYEILWTLNEQQKQQISMEPYISLQDRVLSALPYNKARNILNWKNNEQENDDIILGAINLVSL